MGCSVGRIRGGKVSRSVTEAAPYGVAKVPAPPEVLERIRRTADENAEGEGRTLLRGLLAVAPVLLIVYGAIVLLDLAFAIIEPAHWIVLVMGSTILIVPMLLMHLRDAREAKAAMAATAAAQRRAAEAGEAMRHELRRDTRHWFVEHEHGVMLVCPADDRRTLFLDVSSISDDERHEAWFAPGRIHTDRWVWFTAGDASPPIGFEATGTPLPPHSLEAAAGRYDPEDAVALFEFLGSPADGGLVRKPFATVDAFLRARIAPR